MSIPQPSRPSKRKRTLVKLGAGVLAGLCVAYLVMAAVEKVRDAADRST